MANDKTHNGWTNYATWRVNLEVFDGFSTDGTTYTDAMCREYAEEMVDMALDANASGMANVISGWVNAFLSDVNWQEIADAINEANGTEEQDDAEEVDA